MAESLEETLMSAPQPVQTVQSPIPWTSTRTRVLKSIWGVLVVIGCGAGILWSLICLQRLSDLKRNSLSTSLVEESLVLCGAQAGDPGSQKPFWLQMVGTAASNIVLHFTIAAKSLNTPVRMLDLATTVPITIAMAYTTYNNFYHGTYFALLWWSAAVAIGLPMHRTYRWFTDNDEDDWLGTAFAMAGAAGLLASWSGFVIILTVVAASLLAGSGLVPSYNCSCLPWVRAASLFPTFVNFFCSISVYEEFSRGRFLLNAPFMLLTLIQIPPVLGMLFTQVLPGGVVYLMPLTAAEAIGLGLVLAIGNTQGAKQSVKDIFERLRQGWCILAAVCTSEQCLREVLNLAADLCIRSILLPILFCQEVWDYVKSKVRFESIETPGFVSKYFWVPLEVKMLLVPTVVYCQFTGEAMVRLYQGQGWWQSIYLTWAERTWYEYSQYVYSTGITFQQRVQAIWLQLTLQFIVGG